MRRSLTLITTAILVAGATLTGSAVAQDRQDRQDRSHHTGLPANQVSDQVDARSARIRADLRLTPEQENNWAGFEGAMRDISKKQAEREATLRADRAQQKGSLDVIEQMRRGADSMTEHAVDQKKLADAAQPLFASLNDQQKRRLSEVLVRFGNEPGFN
jgi:LTXXQ motif family protein